MGLVGRVVVGLAASALTSVLLAFAAAANLPRRSRLRRLTGWLPRPDSANLMSYVAALMAVALAGTIALTG